MKKIHFDNISSRKFWFYYLIASAILLLLGIFKPLSLENPRTYKYILTLGLIALIIYLSRMFWYRNYVQWNKKGIVIRIKSLTGKSIRFQNIKNTLLDKNSLTITKTDGNKLIFDLANIIESDSKKLNDILVQNTINAQ